MRKLFLIEITSENNKKIDRALMKLYNNLNTNTSNTLVSIIGCQEIREKDKDETLEEYKIRCEEAKRYYEEEARKYLEVLENQD